MNRRSIGILTAFLLLASLTLLLQEGIRGADITGKTGISSGLLQSGSFSSVEVFDHDGDGKDEIFLGGAGRTNPKTQGIRAYEFDPTSNTWSAYSSGLPGSTSGDYYGALGVGDINGDGNMDIVAPSQTKWYSTSDQKVEIFTSNFQGAFSLSHTFSPAASTSEAEIADIDGDSNMDIVYTYDGGVTVQFGSGSATSWTESSPSASGREMNGVGVGDLNGDGLLDLAATVYSGSNVYIYIQGSSRSWTQLTRSVGSQSFGVKIDDLNGDGNNDIVVGSRSDGIKVWCGNGGGSTGGASFTWTDNSSGLPSSGGDWNQIELGDLDGDGDLDMIASKNSENRSRIYLNNLPNSWTELFSSSPLYLGSGADGYGANFGDWDGNGELDAVACSWGGGVDAWIIDRDTVTPPPENRPPMPDAGEDQEVMLGETVFLDGTESFDHEDAPDGDADGDLLVYDWNVTGYPPGSLIRDGSLSPSDSSAEPFFVPDTAGTYTLTLSVRDTDDAWSNLSDEDNVMITVIKPNDPPVADAGSDVSGMVSNELFFDGSDSYDEDGEIVDYQWSCTSHSVTINGQGTDTASFVPDTATTYNFRLRVKDDNDSWSGYDLVNATVVNPGQNMPPTADAGPDQEIMLGDEVTLDGSGSRDNDGEIVTWEWTCTSHTVEFSNANSSSPSFTPSEADTYSIDLRVRDDNGSWSPADTVEVFVEEAYFNTRPVAVAGEEQEALVGDLVRLDGRNSYDLNGVVEEFNWTCISHDVELTGAMGAEPYFIPDSPGTYIFTLAVMDDEGAWSGEDQVSVVVSEVPEPPTFTIELGPFRYEDDSPLSGAEVRLQIGQNTYNSTTDQDGTASFDGIPEGEHSAEVLYEGAVVIASFTVSVDGQGEVTYPDGYGKADKEGAVDDDDDDVTPPPNDDDDAAEDGAISAVVVIIILVVLTLVAVGGAGLFLYFRREKEEEEDEQKVCPHCGGPLEYKEDFERSRCTECGRYS
ncbi:MAG: FG-GAP-like repeat-containing protein [Thermoplasmatota archaeon]